MIYGFLVNKRCSHFLPLCRHASRNYFQPRRPGKGTGISPERCGHQMWRCWLRQRAAGQGRLIQRVLIFSRDFFLGYAGKMLPWGIDYSLTSKKSQKVKHFSKYNFQRQFKPAALHKRSSMDPIFQPCSRLQKKAVWTEKQAVPTLDCK